MSSAPAIFSKKKRNVPLVFLRDSGKLVYLAVRNFEPIGFHLPFNCLDEGRLERPLLFDV